MSNAFKKITLSDKPTGFFLNRYYTIDGKIGYCAFSPTVEAKKKIKIACELLDIAQGHIKITSINLLYIGKTEPIYFNPRIPLDYLIKGEISLEEEMEREYFYIEPFHYRKGLPTIQMEALHYQVYYTGVSIESFPYPNDHVNARVISVPIPFKDILI